MTRQCMVTGKKPMSGNNVSHANNKTKRRFLPNLQDASFFSEALKKSVSIRATSHGIRTIEHRGGIDAYLLSVAPTKLDPAMRKLRRSVESAMKSKGLKKAA